MLWRYSRCENRTSRNFFQQILNSKYAIIVTDHYIIKSYFEVRIAYRYSAIQWAEHLFGTTFNKQIQGVSCLKGRITRLRWRLGTYNCSRILWFSSSYFGFNKSKNTNYQRRTFSNFQKILINNAQKLYN